MKKLLLLLMVISFFVTTWSQIPIYSRFSIEANLNAANKKRSYGVFGPNKYANSGYFVGWDYGVFYQYKKFNYGVEIFPYRHINASVEYTKLQIVRSFSDLKLIPDIKLGYSYLLDKYYYGFGVNLRYKWFQIGYNKLLHIKSGNSQYHGDGLDSINMGIILRIPYKK